jgi:hypothetical protein
MRLCPHCGYEDNSYPEHVRCDTCGHDLLPEHISQELFNLRLKVNEFDQLSANVKFTLEQMEDKLREAKAEFDARTTDEAIGRAVRRLGTFTNPQVKEVEAAIDNVQADEQASSINEDDIPF